MNSKLNINDDGVRSEIINQKKTKPLSEPIVEPAKILPSSPSTSLNDNTFVSNRENSFLDDCIDNDEIDKTELKPERRYTIVEAYTDGSCIGNGQKNARAGIGIYFPGAQFPDVSERYVDNPTNQRAELTAIYRTINIVLADIKLGTKLKIYTDSEYSLKCLKEYCRKWSINGWIKSDKKPVENLDIIKPLYSLYTQYWTHIDLQHVRAHTGGSDVHSKNNDMADHLARKGCTS
jgi:ribonuclease HI